MTGRLDTDADLVLCSRTDGFSVVSYVIWEYSGSRHAVGKLRPVISCQILLATSS